ncbi:MAG TPA: cation:proton antiporter [Planctomycetia bacterium]|nr:cation:proton antiporter [Planctomycetia bacterium]
MHDIDLILTVTAGLAAALALGYVTHRIGLSPIVGYLLAGLVVGPKTPGFVANRALAEQLAEIGVILLMFGVGLHFHFKELLAVRRVAIPGALVQSLVATALGAAVALAAGWGLSGGLVFGLAISVASTVVLLRVLSDHHELHTPTGHIAVGWLVVEDLFTVFALVAAPAVLGKGGGGFGGVSMALGLATVKIALLALVVVYVGGRFIPWLLGKVAATRSRELFTLTVLTLALGIAVGAAKGFGVSMALGAFLAGMAVGRSDFALRAAAEALPMRDAFAVLFFVSVGMLCDPYSVIRSPLLTALVLAVVLLGKPLAALLVVRVLGKPLAALAIVLALRYPVRTALAVAVSLAQIGEFSFILAAMGRELGVLPEQGTSALVAAAIVSISLNPILFGLVDAAEKRAKRSPRLWKLLSARARPLARASATELDGDGSPRAIVVGYGPVGGTLTRLLRQNGVEPTVVELNAETVRSLRERGIAAVYGDATHKETMIEAGAGDAIAVILTSAGMRGSEEAIRLAREANPKIRVFARTGYVREMATLAKAGADATFSGEGEVALAMTEFILLQLGASPDQVDRERDRIRKELLGGPPPAESLLGSAGGGEVQAASESK